MRCPQELLYRYREYHQTEQTPNTSVIGRALCGALWPGARPIPNMAIEVPSQRRRDALGLLLYAPGGADRATCTGELGGDRRGRQGLAPRS